MKKYFAAFVFILLGLVIAQLIDNKGLSGTLYARVSGPLEFVQQDFDVLRYDAELDLTKAPKTDMKGVCRITFRWTNRTDTSLFYFHLRSLSIDSAFYDNVAVTPVASGSPEDADYHYEIIPPASIKKDTSVITIYYGGAMTGEPEPFPWGGVHTTNGNLYAMGVGFHNNYVSATQHWLPCYDHPSDKAKFHMRFRVMNGKTVASNGTVKTEHPDDSTTIYDWTHNYECSTYLACFAVDNYIAVDIPGGKTPAVVYSIASDTAATRFCFRLLPRMVEAYEKRFGPYAFEKVGYCNTPIGSMEHQTMISYDVNYLRDIYRNRDTVNSVAAHELAHQWFGDMVTCRDFRNAWLNESFATYCESIWQEDLYGFNNNIKYQRSLKNNYINHYVGTEGLMPLYDFPRAEPSSNYPVTIYYKGAVVLGMLRYELGDSVFFPALRSYLDKYRYSVATTEGLKKEFEDKAGHNLDDFFNQWVYRPGYPVISVKTGKQKTDNGLVKSIINITQVQPDSIGIFTNVPIELGFRKKDNSYEYRMVMLNGKDETFTLDSVPDYNYVSVNDGNTVISLLKLNNILSVEDGNISSEPVKFDIYPNPASSTVNIALQPVNGRFSINMTDLNGNQVFAKDYNRGEPTDTVRISTDAFTSGVYYITLEYNGASLTKSVVVAK